MNDNWKRTGECIGVLEGLLPSHAGPAHIVVGDFNLDDGCIQFCIAACDNGEYTTDKCPPGHPIYAATKATLEFLLTIPEKDRIEYSYSDEVYAHPTIY